MWQPLFNCLSNLLQYLLSVHVQMISVCRDIGGITVKACDIAVAGQCPCRIVIQGHVNRTAVPVRIDGTLLAGAVLHGKCQA